MKLTVEKSSNKIRNLSESGGLDSCRVIVTN